VKRRPLIVTVEPTNPLDGETSVIAGNTVTSVGWWRSAAFVTSGSPWCAERYGHANWRC